MWFKKVSTYLLTHPLIALPLMFLLVAATLVDAFKVVPLLPLLMLGGAFALTFAGLITLLQGEVMGAYFMGAVTVPYLIKFGLLWQASSSTPIDWMMAVGILFSCLLNVLIWAVACLLRRGYSWAVLMQSMTLLGVFLLCLLFVFVPGLTAWWVDVLQKPAEIARMQGAMAGGSESPLLSPMQPALLEAVARIATGVMIAGVILCTLLQVMLSRVWQGFLMSPGLLRRELADIHLSRLTGVLFALGVIASSLGEFVPELNNDLITAIMPVAYMLFLLAGLNLAHYFFGLIRSKAKLFWMMFFYIFFVYMAPLSLVLVAMVALFDIWVDLRKRFSFV